MIKQNTLDQQRNHIVDINPTGLAIKSYTTSQALEQPVIKVFFVYSELLEQFRNIEEICTGLVVGNGAGKSLHNSNVSRTPLRVRRGMVAGSLIITLDITDQVQLETELRENTARLEASNRELSDFAHIVSHDLKAPLRGIRQLASWISKDYADALDEGGREKLHLLIDQTKHMHKLIDGILQYSKVGRVETVEQSVDLNRLVQKTVEMLVPPENIQVSVKEELPVVFGDPILLEQVFQNLLSNAINFMDKAEGFVKIGCMEEEDHWQFSVADNGPGIEEEYFDNIFQIFQTLAPRDEAESTGVGLALVKKIVEAWGGWIWVESMIGEGSTFFFTRPKKGESDEGA